MNKLFKKLSLGFAVVVGGLVAFGHNVFAAPDADLASSTEALTSIITDNKGTILTWVAGIFGIVLIMGLAFRALGYGKRSVIGAIPGGKKK